MKKLIICTLFLLSTGICFSQSTIKQPSKFDISKLEFGGNFGLSLGDDATSIIIAPQVGYRFDPRFSAGLGVNYTYYSYSGEKLNYMGFSVYGRVNPFNPLVLQVQPEIYRMWGSSNGSSIESRIVSTLLLGGGIIIPLGAGRGVTMMLYYDVANSEYSPYGNRLFYSVGYTLTF